jgi:hypothetical protein
MTTSGEALRDAALGTHEVTYAEWLLQARRAAWKYAKQNGVVTADEIHHLAPMPKWQHRNAAGAVFKCKWFEQIGFTTSVRKSAHARTIRQYKAVG